jgi:acid phosphatase type 7
MRFKKPYSAVGAAILLCLFAACNDQSTEPNREPADVPEPPPVVEPTDEADQPLTATTVRVISAGDIASCSSSFRDEATAGLVEGISGTVLTLGDHAYPDGTTANFRCYNASWGKFKSRTRPTPGNHEYHTSGAAPYYSYFGARAGPSGRGYYSFNLGGWHIVSLNSERLSSAQERWLKADLAAHPTKCTLAFWHKPLFTSGRHAPATAMRPLFRILYDAGAEIVLSGHNHNYERFAPQTPSGNASSSRGITQFVVGTGGASLYDFTRLTPNSKARYKGHGVLKLDLKATSYSYSFVALSGSSKDSGSGTCH